MILITVKFGDLSLNFSKNYSPQTLETALHQIPNKVGRKNSAAPRFFNPLLRVWISDDTLCCV